MHHRLPHEIDSDQLKLSMLIHSFLREQPPTGDSRQNKDFRPVEDTLLQDVLFGREVQSDLARIMRRSAQIRLSLIGRVDD